MLRAILAATALLAGMTGASAQLATFNANGPVGQLVIIGPNSNQIQSAGTAALGAFALAPYGIMTGLGTATTVAYGSAVNNNTGMFFPTSTQVQLVGNGTAGLTINGSGNVFLPNLTTSSAAQTSYLCQTSVASQVIAVAVAQTCATSSERNKEDITPLAGLGLDTVLALQPVTYHYRLTGNDKFDYAPNQRSWQIGFTAEQAESVDPRLITVDEQGRPSSFRYEQYVAVLTAAIQQQQQQIDELRRELRKNRHAVQ